jgi:hypothetical protein
MTPPMKDLKLLLQRSGNRCAFPSCGKILDHPGTTLDDPVVLSEVAHIVSQKAEGPRGSSHLSAAQRDKYENLILLCSEHHKLVDQQPATYGVERLKEMKRQHEAMIAEATKRISLQQAGEPDHATFVAETLLSTLFPIIELPRCIYSVDLPPQDLDAGQISRIMTSPSDPIEIAPFIIRGSTLYSFQDLRRSDGPFAPVVTGLPVKKFSSSEWWGDPDRLRLFQDLLNRALNKLTGRKGLNLDKPHRRYFFMPSIPGKPLTVSYQPLNQSRARRKVVWQPTTRKTGRAKNYWLHRAITLRFLKVGSEAWCLTMRPGFHVTSDGLTAIDSSYVGRRVTRKEARQYNYDFLGELQFWRDFLGEGKPRIVLSFGPSQILAISTKMLQSLVSWPGMPKEHQREFRNIEYFDDLFTWSEWARIESAEAIDEGGELGPEEDDDTAN